MNRIAHRGLALAFVLAWTAAAGGRARPAGVHGEGAGGPTTYYVRPDGGSADQCTGLVDAPYPGSGTDQPCA